MLCIHLCMMYFECVLIKFLGYRSFFRALKIHHIISFYKQIFSGTQEARKNTKQKQNQTKEEKLKPLYHISNIWFLDRIKKLNWTISMMKCINCFCFLNIAFFAHCFICECYFCSLLFIWLLFMLLLLYQHALYAYAFLLACFFWA